MSEPATALTKSFDIDWWALLSDRAFLIDPYPKLKRIQALGPIHSHEALGVYFVLGHHEFGQIVKAPQMGRDTRLWKHGWHSPENQLRDPAAFQLFSELQPEMISSNPPDHGRMRAVYETAFRPNAVAALAPMIQAVSDQLLDAMPVDSHADFMEHYAAPMPLTVLLRMFEIPVEMDEQIASWSSSLVKILDIMTSPEQKQAAQKALTEFKAYLRELLDWRRRNPGHGILDAAVAAYDDGTLSEQETLINLVAMLIAGHETTVTLLGNGMFALLKNPAQMELLRANRELIRTAIEEFLRYEPGGKMLLRVAIEDFRVGTVQIPAGSLVIGLVGAINRDPARFEHPDELDISRLHNAQFTFGGGIHMCIGAPLARLEAKIAFNSVLDRYAHIELDGEPEWRLDPINARVLNRLPVRLGART